MLGLKPRYEISILNKANLPTRWVLMIRDKPKETLNSFDKLISFTLKTYMNNETGECYPTNERIAHDASCHVKTVRKVMRKLVRLGFLKRWKEKPKSGTGHYHYHYKAIIYGEHSSSIDSTLRNKKVNIEESQIHNKGNNIPPNYEDNYTNNSDLNNRQSNGSRIDGFQKLSVVEFLKNINKKNLELND
jgi:predicted transcriptional regulator